MGMTPNKSSSSRTREYSVPRHSPFVFDLQSSHAGKGKMSSGISTEMANCGTAPPRDIGPRQESRRNSDEQKERYANKIHD